MLLGLLSCNKQAKLKVVRSVYPNGNIQQIVYYDLPVTDDSIGISEVYLDNGKLKSRGTIKNGKLNGKWISYLKNGQIENRVDFINGLIHGTGEAFFEDGSWTKKTFVHDVLNGPTIECIVDSSGQQIWINGQYKDNEMDGLWTWKDKEMKVIKKEFYSEDKLDKWVEEYNTKGVLKLKAYYHRDNCDSVQIFDNNGILLRTHGSHSVLDIEDSSILGNRRYIVN